MNPDLNSNPNPTPNPKVKKGGITFGNDQAGAGTADLTAQTAGSAGVMQRSEVRSREKNLNPNLNPQ